MVGRQEKKYEKPYGIFIVHVILKNIAHSYHMVILLLSYDHNMVITHMFVQ